MVRKGKEEVALGPEVRLVQAGQYPEATVKYKGRMRVLAFPQEYGLKEAKRHFVARGFTVVAVIR